MSIIVTGTIPKALKPGVKTYWGAYTEDDLLASKLVKMESTDEQFDEDVLISPFGLLKTKTKVLVLIMIQCRKAMYQDTNKELVH